MRYTVFLRQHDGLHYAVVPLLPLCSAQGRTREEVLHNVKVANELPRSKLRGIKPPLAYSHGPASLAGWMLVYRVYVLHACEL